MLKTKLQCIAPDGQKFGKIAAAPRSPAGLEKYEQRPLLLLGATFLFLGGGGRRIAAPLGKYEDTPPVFKKTASHQMLLSKI